MWTVKILDDAVEAEIRALPEDLRARLGRAIDLIETEGLDRLPRDLVRHLEGKLWELRIQARSGISRAIYVTANRKLVIVVRVFVKKTQKTPTKELAIARRRAKDIE
ncbi:MAG: hypothetical protein BGO82_02295 [Devosia sp. 67-54]|uniref:type II toxin-antitoxin system RelE/ParE family toxin n=1 Tax=unclassified Devosia TaxID=196773 RepID=UPI00086E70A5|nr:MULTISPECIES: type II toxin-antitoxin system RelE/ParE family toxin [unclassified Devosia]MBN9305296.1 type II toxin-antitoxin system RelE/ParE family toxin [Devosia sp.]ODU62592.1 MAG: hypothetical protein ABT13_00760 [Pelagibacterium sp. SCN 68-10]OJX18900.1 MAG: hypothetical protein BGO82_02295 [Devosia sp. 67-54]